MRKLKLYFDTSVLNFAHIVKLKTKREVVGVNIINGYKEIEICSPLEVLE